VRLVGSKTFSLVDGIWMDTSYDPDAMTTLRVPFLSADYFTLANSRSELGDAFALGQNVIIVVEGVAYEVVGADEQGDQIVLPEAQVEEEESVSGSEDSSSPGVSDPGNREYGFSIPCLGSSLIGLLPLALVFRSIKAYRD